VELIELRSIDLHSINSKSTFRPPQRGKRTGTYCVCILGVRLCYWHHGEHGLKVQLEDKCIQYWFSIAKRGVCPRKLSLHFLLCSETKLLMQPICRWKDLVLFFHIVFFIFVVSFFSCKFLFCKTYSIQYTGRFGHQKCPLRHWSIPKTFFCVCESQLSC
jgi:hypothetical protein